MLEHLGKLSGEQWTALSAIGTWIGGLGSAGAAGVAVGVAWSSFKAQQRQQTAYLISMTTQLIPEVVKVANLGIELEISHGVHIHNPQALVYVQSSLSIPITNKLVEMGGMGSTALALAAGELVASTKLILDNIQMVELGGPKDHLSMLAMSNAKLVFFKALSLAKAIQKESPSASTALQSVFDMEAERTRRLEIVNR